MPWFTVGTPVSWNICSYSGSSLANSNICVAYTFICSAVAFGAPTIWPTTTP